MKQKIVFDGNLSMPAHWDLSLVHGGQTLLRALFRFCITMQRSRREECERLLRSCPVTTPTSRSVSTGFLLIGFQSDRLA